MQMIEQPTIIIFDEFEKVYDNEEQEKLLTLLDGVYPSKKLFVITTNDKYRVNQHMRNRPGRIFYRLDYTGLEREFIIEYCEDNLDDKTHIESICRFSMMFNAFNFDMLKALVEEMNRYKETPQEAMRMLNAKPEQDDGSRYKAILNVDGKPVTDASMEESEWRGNPLSQQINIGYYVPAKTPDDEDDWFTSSFTAADLNNIDATTGMFQFTNPKGHKLSLTKVVAQTYNYESF